MYILYIIFQLKSHAYLYASIPQQIIDEESHPGVLADFLNSSSESSTSSSEDSVDTTTSWTTAKRLKRAMKYRKRRKSSTSSKGTTSRQSVQKKVMVNENKSSLGNSIASHGESGSCVVDFGDEARYDADDDGQPSNEFRSRDFGLDINRVESNRSDKAKKRDRKKRHSRKTEKADKAREGLNVDSSKAPADSARPSMKGFVSSPTFAGMSNVGETENPRRRSPFGPIPSLLSNTVFSSQTPGNSPRIGTSGPRPGIARSNSLPAHINRAPPVGNAVQFARGAARVPTVTDPVAQNVTTQESEPIMSRTAAVVMLLLSTALVAVCAEFLVDAIPSMIESSTVSEAFIGLIILPIVGNAAEHVTAVSVATKNKMDLSIGVSVGSSIQIGGSPECVHSQLLILSSYFCHPTSCDPRVVHGQGHVPILHPLRDHLPVRDSVCGELPCPRRTKQLPRGCSVDCRLCDYRVSLASSIVLWVMLTPLVWRPFSTRPASSPAISLARGDHRETAYGRNYTIPLLPGRAAVRPFQLAQAFHPRVSQ